MKKQEVLHNKKEKSRGTKKMFGATLFFKWIDPEWYCK